MSAFKGITLHEGYNDIGTFDVNITEIENPARISSYVPELPKGSRKILFRFLFDTDEPVPQNYVGTFTALGRITDENVEYIASPNADGYLEINTPVFPVAVIADPDETVLRL